MPQFIITAPDGRKFKVTAPEGATKEQALARIQQQYGESRTEKLKRENPAEYDPQSDEYQAKYGATSGMTGVQNFLAGAGKSVVDTGRGIKQLGAEAGNRLGLVSNETVRRMRTNQDEVNKLDAALMRTGSGVAGNIAGTVAQAVIPGGVAARAASAARLPRVANAARAVVNPATYRAAAASGALQGAVRPVGTDESRAVNAIAGAAGGVAGNAAVNAVGRVAQPIRKALDPADQRAVGALEAAGVPLDAAQRSPSAVVKRVKAALSDNPFTAGRQQDVARQQQYAFNRAALRNVGANANAATPAVMDAARQRIGAEFDRIAANNPIRVDNRLRVKVTNLLNQARREMDDRQVQPLQNLVDDATSKIQGGRISGRLYQNLKTSLDRISAGADQARGQVARDIRSALDDALMRSASARDVAALRQARRQWGNLRTIESAIDNEGAGNISPSKLANAFGTKAKRSQSRYGRGDQKLVQLAQAGKRVLPEKLPNSGTAPRALMQFLPAAIAGGGAGLYSGDASTAGQVALGVYAIPRAAQAVINSPAAANYLSRGLPAGVVRNALLAPSRNALVSVPARQFPIAASIAE